MRSRTSCPSVRGLFHRVALGSDLEAALPPALARLARLIRFGLGRLDLGHRFGDVRTAAKVCSAATRSGAASRLRSHASRRAARSTTIAAMTARSARPGRARRFRGALHKAHARWPAIGTRRAASADAARRWSVAVMTPAAPAASATAPAFLVAVLSRCRRRLRVLAGSVFRGAGAAARLRLVGLALSSPSSDRSSASNARGSCGLAAVVPLWKGCGWPLRPRPPRRLRLRRRLPPWPSPSPGQAALRMGRTGVGNISRCRDGFLDSRRPRPHSSSGSGRGLLEPGFDRNRAGLRAQLSGADLRALDFEASAHHGRCRREADLEIVGFFDAGDFAPLLIERVDRHIRRRLDHQTRGRRALAFFIERAQQPQRGGIRSTG